RVVEGQALHVGPEVLADARAIDLDALRPGAGLGAVAEDAVLLLRDEEIAGLVVGDAALDLGVDVERAHAHAADAAGARVGEAPRLDRRLAGLGDGEEVRVARERAAVHAAAADRDAQRDRARGRFAQLPRLGVDDVGGDAVVLLLARRDGRHALPAEREA